MSEQSSQAVDDTSNKRKRVAVGGAAPTTKTRAPRLVWTDDMVNYLLITFQNALKNSGNSKFLKATNWNAITIAMKQQFPSATLTREEATKNKRSIPAASEKKIAERSLRCSLFPRYYDSFYHLREG
jgi:hypothetical protein